MRHFSIRKRFFIFPLHFALFLFILGFWACKSVGPIEVEQDKYDLPGITVVDTISVRTNEYTYYRLSADQPWVLLDTQTTYNANQLITFVVLENTEGQVRNAKITISGEDLTPKDIEIVQQPGGSGTGDYGDGFSEAPSVPETSGGLGGGTYQGDGDYNYVEEKPARTPRRIKTENAMVELPEEKTEAAPAEAPALAPAAKEAPKVVEKPKPILELSSDQVNLGAAEELESDEITLKASGKWTVQNPADWLSVIDGDGVEVKAGEKDKTFNIKTLKPNPALEPRKATITFMTDSTLKQTITVTQKATEAKITLSTNSIALDGDMSKAKDQIAIAAVGTAFKITGVPAWIKLSTTAGEIGDNAIDISATDDNTTTSQRKATLMVSSTGNVIQKEIVVTQDPLPSPIDVSELSGDLERDKESIQTFTLTASKSWSIKIPKGVTWLSVDQTSGEPQEDEITITVTSMEENTGVPRRTILQVVSGKFVRNVSVLQEGDEEGDVVDDIPKPVEEDTTAGEEVPPAEATPAPTDTTQKEAAPVIKPVFTVTSGSIAGEFYPYVLLGNPKLYEEDPATTAPSVTIKINANQDFTIENEPFDNLDTFYTIMVNQKPYTYNDVIKQGKDIQITFKASADNIQKKDNSKVSHIQFKTLQGTVVQFDDSSAKMEKMEKFEIKQEPYVFKRPFIKVYGMDFDGYNSTILLGNPSTKGEDALPTTVSITIEANTPFAISMLVEGDEKRKNSNFNISYSTKKHEGKRYSYKLGDKLDAGEYDFTISVKKNYTDPQGVGSRYTESLIFNIIEGKVLTPYEYVDMDNYSVDLSYFRELLLIEQESLESPESK